MTPSPLLDAQRLTKRFGGIAAVNQVSFQIQPGTRTALIGPNGAGKSTLFGLLGGQGKADAGHIRFLGQDITAASPARRAQLGIARSFQTASIFDSMSPRDGIAAVLSEGSGAVRLAHADHLLTECGLHEVSGPHHTAPARDLAYGDLKRLELAMALAARPRLLLLDEPTAGCAPSERRAMMAAVTRAMAARPLGGPKTTSGSDSELALLFTEHDMDVVFGHADRIIVLNRGSIIADADPDSIRADPMVRSIYLGDG